MKKNVCLSILMVLVMVFSTTMPVLAAPERERNPNGSDVEQITDIVYIDGARYFSGQVVFEVFWTECGEVVSREYVDVLLSEYELNDRNAFITPMTTMPKRTVFLWAHNPQDPRLYTFVGEVTGLGLGSSQSTLNFHHEGSTLINTHVYVITNTLNTILFRGRLVRGQSVRITIPWGALSYTVAATSQMCDGRGGWATFSITN